MMNPIELDIFNDSISLEVIDDVQSLQAKVIGEETVIPLIVIDNKVSLEVFDDIYDLQTGVEIVEKEHVIPYGGSYEFTPLEDAQIIEIKDKKAIKDIVINPIPENYARMSFSGNIITFY